MSRFEQRLVKLEARTLPTRDVNRPKVIRVEKPSVEEWNEYVTYKSDYELKTLPDQDDNCLAVRMEFVKTTSIRSGN